MEYSKIDASHLENVGKIDFKKMHNDSFVDVTEELPKPPSALSIGTVTLGQEIFDCDFGTYGNFSCIVGASKVKKTFLKSLIVANYIGGSASNYAEQFKSHRKEDKFILDFDTEQGKWHAQRVFKRVGRITNNEFINGKAYPFYKPFYLRKYTYYERLQFIEYMMLESEYRNNIGFVNIDGFADLVKSTNDEDGCNELVEKLMKWTEISKCHLTGILHTNPGSQKARGHLGSSVMRKAETVCSLNLNEQNNTYTDVSFNYTRGFPIDDFSFRINEFGLPIIENVSY